MPIKKLDDVPAKFIVADLCRDLDHQPNVALLYLSPGTYEHECPSCQRKTIFTVASNQRHG